jgi:glycosyltransferase involved in cell wall biosynthesis
MTAVIRGLEACTKYKCDIIYVPCHYAYGGGSWVGLIAPYIVSLLLRKPLVVVFHHIEPQDYKEKNPIKLKAYRKATCLAVSKATASALKKCLPVQEVTVVGNGINLDLFRTESRERKRFDAVFLGRIAEEKGVFYLLNAWKSVVEKQPSARLLFIGGADRVTKTRLEKEVSNLQLAQNVTFVGFVSDDEMAGLLKASRIFVLPSLREGFGLVVAEAMTAGLPCIISDLPALKEIYSSAAILVQPSNAQRLAEAITGLLSDPEKMRELKKKGRNLVDRFSWEEVAKREFNILKRISENRN